jgi:histone deacetylase complex regulatory component SIN3
MNMTQGGKSTEDTKLNQAIIYHSKVLKQYKNQEYFEVLNNSQKCSNLFRNKDKVMKLNELLAHYPNVFTMVLDCFKFSSIAYL